MSDQITLEELLEQIERIPAEWLNDIGRKVIDAIPKIIGRINRSPLDQSTITTLLEEETYALDVFRLFLDLSQDAIANEINARGIRGDFASIRSKCSRHADEIAEALVTLGLIDTIEAHRARDWKLQDILLERYKHMRGHAIRGQRRGAAIENAVEDILKGLQHEIGISYDSKANFISRSGEEAKADFVIPSRFEPQIIIEVKGYEATGSKLTDVLGDILKILKAKDPETYFFLVTDGIGWYRRLSDLRHIVAYHHSGEIEMIYTRKTLLNLKDRIRQIIKGE
ncbi:TPA: hypothetical protein ENG04_01235 [Candidatus Poribacteria bacterium]|nr:hypothetical protein [Candidatus Poribacteria bacterium]HEX28688.1 hypothetical protein [Candidatus Poribacteria bacterium]